MTRLQAISWLARNGKYPLAIERYWRNEGRWYPESEGNLRHFGETNETHCLLPRDIYFALPFPEPEGWGGEGEYPWFPTWVAAVEAAIETIMERM